MAEALSKADVLRKTHDLLRTTQRGLSDLKGADPTVRPMGMHNVAVFGRSVTLALQNLRTIDREAFDEWYAPFKAEMSEDPPLRYFTKLRNEILKVGPPSLGSSIYIESLDSRDMMRLMANPPPSARGFFIGDPLGGSGWEIEMPDGSVGKYYVQLPPDIRVQISLRLPDPPEKHQDQELDDPSLEELAVSTSLTSLDSLTKPRVTSAPEPGRRSTCHHLQDPPVRRVHRPEVSIAVETVAIDGLSLRPIRNGPA